MSIPYFLLGFLTAYPITCLFLCNVYFMHWNPLLLFSHSVVSDSLQLHDCSMPGFPVLHHLLGLLILMSCESVMPSNRLILCHPLLQPSIFPSIRVFSRSQFFASRSQSIGVSASTSVLPMNIQDWFPLGLTGLISLQSKGLSRVFSNTTVQKHKFFGTQPK